MLNAFFGMMVMITRILKFMWSKALPIGLSCSPDIAQYVKNKNAEDFKQEFPKAVEAITRNHYVDNMIERDHDIDFAVKLIEDVQFIHRHAYFDLRL